jgi:quercetin dioxygenase-like cupin family protein
MDLSFQQFESQLRALGFDTVVERKWGPSAVADTHSHPFEARALVVKGEMWLTIDGMTRHLKAGDRFELLPGQLHSERYGHEGAVYWVGRRHAAEASDVSAGA